MLALPWPDRRGTRVRRASDPTDTLPLVGAFIRRDALVAWSYRLPLALDLVQTFLQLTFLFVLARLIGGRISPGSVPGSYFGFVVLGASLLGILTTGLNSFSDRLRADQTSGTMEALLASPTGHSRVVIASAAYDMLYATATSTLAVLVAVLVFGLRLDATPATLAVAFVTVVAAVSLFASAGLALAAFVVVYKRGNGLVSLVTTGLTMIAGVYYPTRLLPGPLHVLAAAIPFTWALDVLRQALLTGHLLVGRLALLVGTAAALLPLAVWLLGRALVKARRDGSLGQF